MVYCLIRQSVIVSADKNYLYFCTVVIVLDILVLYEQIFGVK